MNQLLKIALRNIFRNRRRSVMTGSAVSAGALATLLFGGFAAYIFAGLETNNVQRIGHLTLFRSGYFLFGAGNPAAYGIEHYRDVMALIGNDPVLRPMINVMTPTQSLLGSLAKTMPPRPSWAHSSRPLPQNSTSRAQSTPISTCPA